MRKYLVPVLSLAVLVSGGVVAVDLLQRSQSSPVEAGSFLQEVAGIKFPGGDAVVTYVYNGSGRPVTEMFMVDESKWVPVKAESIGGSRYQVLFDDNLPRMELWIRVNGEEALVPFRTVGPDPTGL